MHDACADVRKLLTQLKSTSPRVKSASSSSTSAESTSARMKSASSSGTSAEVQRISQVMGKAAGSSSSSVESITPKGISKPAKSKAGADRSSAGTVIRETSGEDNIFSGDSDCTPTASTEKFVS